MYRQIIYGQGLGRALIEKNLTQEYEVFWYWAKSDNKKWRVGVWQSLDEAARAARLALVQIGQRCLNISALSEIKALPKKDGPLVKRHGGRPPKNLRRTPRYYPPIIVKHQI